MKTAVIRFLFWALVVNAPTYAQDPIQIEIDSAPVEIEIQKPKKKPEPAKPVEPVSK